MPNSICKYNGLSNFDHLSLAGDMYNLVLQGGFNRALKNISVYKNLQ